MKKRSKVLSVLLAMTMTAALVSGCGGKEETPAETPETTEEQPAGEAEAPEENAEEAEASQEAAEGAMAAKFSATFPATGTQAEGINQLGEFLKEESEGRIVMELYPSSQLGDKIAAMEGMISGTIEMSEFAATDFSNYDDMWSVLSLPYLWDTEEQAIGTLTDPEVSAFLAENVEQYGMKIIAWQNLGTRSILNSKRKVETPKDLNGLTIRCMQDAVLAGTINAMGASATPMAWGEVYTALQQGTIDGIYTHPAGTYGNKLCEVTDYCTIINLSYITTFKLLSEKAVEKLGGEGSELYNIVVEAGREAEVHKDELIAANNEKIDEMMAEEGVTIIRVTPEEQKLWNEAAQAIWPKFIGEGKMVDQGLFDRVAAME